MNENKLLTTSEVAKKLGVTPDCIRKWDESGVLKADYTTEGGHRKYKESTVNEYLEKDTLGSFNVMMTNVREEWAKKKYVDLSEKIEERTNSYLTDEKNKTCMPVVRLGDDDTIALVKDGFIVRTGFYLSGHPFLSDAKYTTDMKTRYEYMSALNGKSNPTLEKWMEYDIDNVWAYINWEYYTVKDFSFQRLSSEQFIKIILEENFEGIIHNHKDELKSNKYSVQGYERYITCFAKQVMDYYLIKHHDEFDYDNEDFRTWFKKGDYAVLRVIFKSGIYTFRFENNSSNWMSIHVFDECKFNKIMNAFKHNLIKCELSDSRVGYVDDIIDEVFGDVKEDEDSEKSDIIVDASFMARVEGFNQTVDISENDMLKLGDKMNNLECVFLDEMSKNGIVCVDDTTPISFALGRTDKKTDIEVGGLKKWQTRLHVKHTKEYDNDKQAYLLKALKEKLDTCKYLVLDENYETKFIEPNTDLNDENKVWKENELKHLDFPIIHEFKDNAEHNRVVRRVVFCPCCGNTLHSKTPTMYNPFSMESQAVCVCDRCGKTVKTEHAYPRLVFKDVNGDDLKVWM